MPQKQGPEENLGFGLPTTAVVSTKFNDRVNEVFGSLQSLEQKHSETVATFATNEDDADEEEERVSDEESMCSQGSNKQQLKRKTTLSKCDFRRKLDNNRCQNVPNYIANPEKWKKYSLKDDGSSSMSTGRSADELNTAVAMDFLSQLKKRKSTGSDVATSTDSSASSETSSSDKANDAHTFSVPSLPNRNQPKETTDDEDTAVTNKASSSNHSTKAWCMETFEFGKASGPAAKKKKTLPVRTDDAESGKCGVVLEHCQEDDENEDEGNGINEEKSDIKIDDIDSSCTKVDNGASAPVLFNSRGRKQKRGIRKRQQSEDDDRDGGDDGGVGDSGAL